MTQNQSITSYSLLAVALAASLLYRPVIAADPGPSQATAAEPEAASALRAAAAGFRCPDQRDRGPPAGAGAAEDRAAAAAAAQRRS